MKYNKKKTDTLFETWMEEQPTAVSMARSKMAAFVQVRPQVKEKKSQSRKNWNANNTLSEQTRAKLSVAGRKPKKHTRPMSEEHRRLRSEANKGKPKPKTQCIYCGKMVANNLLHRYHMENCKHKP